VVEGGGRGEVVEGVEDPGTAARLGAAPIDGDGLRAPAGVSLRLGLLRRGLVKLIGGEGSERGGE
jgi:hypothetical protein